MDRVECVVAGAGAVGLAVARALALQGREVVILEAAEAIGTGTSSRNSEVIHAGIYYPKGSLMARFCVAGRRALYSYCADHGVAHRRCGKLIVATAEEEKGKLAGIAARARANGVEDIREITAAAARALEPELACTAALLSPSTGIVDSHGFMLALQGDAEAAGAMLAFETPLRSARVERGGFTLLAGRDGKTELSCEILVNSAGLEAPRLARSIVGMPADLIPQAYFAKGSYFQLSGRSPFTRLVYPAPVPGGLGVHLTLDLQGRARFGPDVEWIETVDYDVDPRRADSFYAAIRRYWPALPDGALDPAYSGVRPKIVPPGAPAQDFLIQGPQAHGVLGLVNLFGIESPGLTAALAIGDWVAGLARTDI